MASLCLRERKIVTKLSGGCKISVATGGRAYAFPLSGFSTTPNPPNTPTPTLIFSHDDRGFVDSHDAVLTRHNRFIWVADRAANDIVVVDAARDDVVNEFSLAGKISGDPAHDLMDISPNGKIGARRKAEVCDNHTPRGTHHYKMPVVMGPAWRAPEGNIKATTGSWGKIIGRLQKQSG